MNQISWHKTLLNAHEINVDLEVRHVSTGQFYWSKGIGQGDSIFPILKSFCYFDEQTLYELCQAQCLSFICN